MLPAIAVLGILFGALALWTGILVVIAVRGSSA